MVKKKTVLFLSFLCPSGSKVQGQTAMKYTPSIHCCSEHITPPVKGHPSNSNGQQAGELSEQFNGKYSLKSPPNDSILQQIIFNMWNWTGAKIICTHNSLYHHLHFKNCNDTFCKSNRLLVVPHATQLLLIILWSIHFTHQENTLKNICSVFPSSLLVCVCYWSIKSVLMIMTFLKIKPLHTKS